MYAGLMASILGFRSWNLKWMQTSDHIGNDLYIYICLVAGVHFRIHRLKFVMWNGCKQVITWDMICTYAGSLVSVLRYRGWNCNVKWMQTSDQIRNALYICWVAGIHFKIQRLKFEEIYSKSIWGTISRTTKPILGLFVLIWMYFNPEFK